MPSVDSIRILHLEDNSRDAELIHSQLAAAGLACEIVVADTKQRFEAALAGKGFDLILVDFNIAGYDGSAALQVTQQCRQSAPVIVVSGTLGEEAAVECLKLGAADYVLKQRSARLVPAVHRALAEAAERSKRRLAEADLRETTTQLERAQAVAQLGSWTFDVARDRFHCSAETYRIYGRTPEAPLNSEDFNACVHSEDLTYVDRSWRATLRGERPYDLVYRIRVGGVEKWVHERAEITRDDAGRVVRIVGMVQDVTERERDRSALVASEHFLRATLSALQDSIVVLDSEGRILKANQAWREFAELNKLDAAHVEEGADYLGVCDRAAETGAVEASEAAQLIRDLLNGRRAYGGFDYACHSPHEKRWFHCRGTRFQSGEHTHVVISHTNITARRQAEDALRRLNAELEQIVRARTSRLELANAELTSKEGQIQSILDNLLSCVISINDKGIIVSASAAVNALLGYSVEEVVGQNVSLLMPERDRASHDGSIDRYLNSGEARIIGINREVEGQHKDGTRIPLELNVNQYTVAGRRHFTGIMRDSRERLRILNDLKNARDHAEKANRAKSEFLAAMSHEIRTPMNGVIGMIDVLHQTILEGDQFQMIELMRESAYSLLTIINDILDYSKIEAGRLGVERIPMQVEQVVERACAILDRAAQHADVQLTLYIDPTIPKQVLGDPNRLRQVLFNLVSNAIKFSRGRAGRVWVRAHLIDCDSERATLEFRVADNGIGMDAETLSRLFTPFTQADVSTTRRFGGTGLGLAISRELTELMGGQITVQSAVGEGSTFSVRLTQDLLSDGHDARAEVSNVAGLSCVVIGSADGLAGHLAVYLEHAGAMVRRASDPAGAPERTGCDSHGVLVCVIDTDDERLSPDELLAKISLSTQPDDRRVLIVIERGRRRTPRRIAPNVIMVDGNVLCRETFLTAVAAAAGRATLPAPEESGKSAVARVASPSREEALQQGCLILVVEDNETNQKVILTQLHALGFTADIANNGRDALRRWDGGSYGLVLTDLHMPEMDGYELTAAIRARETGARRVPIVAFTANALKVEADRCREVGLDDYLTKPVSLADLKVKLELWLPAAQSAADSSYAAGKSSVPQADVAPPLDLNALKALIGDNETVISEVLQDFTAHSGSIVAELRAACGAGQSAAARAAAHKLKSSARAIGALALGELCADMERAGEAADISTLTEKLPLFDKEMKAVDAYLKSL